MPTPIRFDSWCARHQTFHVVRERDLVCRLLRDHLTLLHDELVNDRYNDAFGLDYRNSKYTYSDFCAHCHLHESEHVGRAMRCLVGPTRFIGLRE